MNASRKSYLERWIPAVIVGAFLLDVAFHFVRLDFLAFRGDEAVGLVVPLGRRFEARRQYRSDRTSGDIASMGNLPEYRVYRPQVFTTDDLGYRNAMDAVQRPPSVVMLGSSFTVGTGNSDEQTLARRLEAISGCPVYSAGGWDRLVTQAREIVRRVGMKDGLVLLDIVERDGWGPPIAPADRKRRFRYSALIWWYYDQACRSRLKIVAQRVYKALSNDRFLPNVHKSSVAVRELPDGRPMLFLGDMQGERPTPAYEDHIRAIEQLRDALREDGHRLAVYLIPEKLTVYRDLLRDPGPRADRGGRILAEFERRLRERGIPVINLEPILHDAAHDAFGRGELIYWPDDTHWNPDGIDIAARAISRAFDVPAACRRPAARD